MFVNVSYVESREMVERRGGKVKVIKYDDGSWELVAGEQPYFIKGVVFTPVKIGEDPGQATMRDWMYYDDNKNSKNDIAYDSWVDINRNNAKDPNESVVGDFQLLQDMGVNTIRLYHLPSDDINLGSIYKDNPSVAIQYNHAINKKLLRELHKNYGIKVIMGNFLGSWTIGAGSTWEEGTDYTNPKHRENIKKSVKAMVLENKDEPYVLFWALGNENNIADWSKCNAKQNPEAYAKFIGELTRMIHKLDPEHPVAVVDGEDSFQTLRQYAKHAKEIDIIAYNNYRDETGLNIFWKQVKDIFDRPVYLSEIGRFAYTEKIGEVEAKQLKYVQGTWRSIVRASAEYYREAKGFEKGGNSIGVTFFDWIDRWYMDGLPDEHNQGARYWLGTDELLHEEWYGFVSMGNGSDWLMRQKRKSYEYLRSVWNKDELFF